MDVDVIVIGSGQAGVPLATRLAGAGRRVVLVERSALGGTCVNRGCTPTKTMIASAEVAHAARRGPSLGVATGEVRVDLEAVVDRKNGMVGQWRRSVQETVADAGDALDLVRGHARFVGPRTVDVEGVEHRAPTVIVNVGGRPAVSPIPGLDDVGWLDSTSVMELRELPDHLVVLGGGYIGCEFGQAFRRFGAEVTIVDRNDRILKREDAEVSEALQDAFRDEGIGLRLGAGAGGVRRVGAGVGVELDDASGVEGSHLLLALGRRPNTDDLGCGAAGVETDARGFIVVDDRYRTTAEGIFAVGDCTGGPPFTHASWDDHRILFDILTGDGRRTRADRLVPHAVFTDPQVARVGLSEREAEEEGLEYEVATMPFGHVARAIETGQRAGVMKVLLDPDTERFLGVSLVGAQAGELIHVFAVLMEAGAPATALVDAEMIHPTFAEGLQSLVMRLDRYALS